MAVTGGLKPSELDAATVTALQTKLGYDAGVEMSYGQGLMNIRRKIRTMIDLGKPVESIRIAVFGDSVFQSSTVRQGIIDYFNDTWGIPDANVDVNCCFGAYTPDYYVPCLDGAAIQPNVDLVIINEDQNYMLEQMVAKIKSKTNADIMFGSWSINGGAGYPRYYMLVDIAKKHGCELFDINALLMRKYLDGTWADYVTSPESVHLSAAGGALVLADFVKHFDSARYYNEFVNFEAAKEDVMWLGAEKLMPVWGVTFSGTWSVLTGGTAARSSTATDYIEFTFTGIGFEILFAENVAENIHNVLVDSAAPSAYATPILEYCTQIIGKTQTVAAWYWHRFFKAEVTAPFMTNAEEEVEFEIVIGTPVRVDGVLTELPYTLNQGVTELGTGDIFSDATFVFRTTGEITIPALVYGLPNYVESNGAVFTVGDTMQFFARKTWKDSIDTNTETFLRVAGLARASHTVRITKASAVASDLKYLSLYK